MAGNFLNSGGYAGNAAGFKMLSLLKLTDIRANKPSVTLLHYVAEQARKKRPELLSFGDEVPNLEEASKISMETLKTDVSSLNQRVSKVSTQVAVAESEIKSQMQDFLEFAETKVEIIQNEINNLESIRHKLSEFFCEDTDSFKLEDCFKVFHSFCRRFKAAIQENERRQQQEKLAEARKKQREEQMVTKRRSLELSDSRSNVGADHIMDQLLGDIRNGFPERRLTELCKRNKRNSSHTDEISRNQFDDSKNKQQFVLKRHSDPTMMGKCDDSQQDEKSGKNRRARFFDDPEDDELMGYLQNPADIEKQRKSFGSVDDCSQERITTTRRSGRRKRIEFANGDVKGRERASSPQPSPLPVIEDTVSEVSSKQKLIAKIDDWMLQNEREQERERNLLSKLKKERAKRMNGHINGDLNGTDSEKCIEEEINETTLLRNDSDKTTDQSRITKASLLRQSDSFTQKIIGLLDAASDKPPKKLERSRLYHSAREASRRQNNEIYLESDLQVNDSALKPLEIQPKIPSVNKSENVESKCNFDRSAPTRKTQRRLKLREMRIEAEHTKLSPSVIKGIEAKDVSCTSPNSDELASSVEGKASNETSKIPPDDKSEFLINSGSSDFIEEEASENCKKAADVEEVNNIIDSYNAQNEKESLVNRSRGTSLRSRQSRLARRIDSLTIPVTLSDAKITSEKSFVSADIDNEETKFSDKPTSNTLPVDSPQELQNPKPFKNAETNNDEEVADHKFVSKSVSQTEDKNMNKSTDQRSNKSTEDNSKKSPATESNQPLVNSQVLHKVIVSTETKSKVIVPKARITRNSKITAPNNTIKTNTSYKKPGTNIPSVIRTVQNIKVHQTVEREPQMNGKVIPKTIKEKSALKDRKNISVPSKVSSPKPTPLQTSSTGKQTFKNVTIHDSLANGKMEAAASQANRTSNISTLSSTNAYSKPLKGDRSKNTVNGKAIRPSSTQKITINHNDNVQVLKGNSTENIKMTTKSQKQTASSSVTSKCSTETLIKKQDNFSSTRKKIAA